MLSYTLFAIMYVYFGTEVNQSPKIKTISDFIKKMKSDERIENEIKKIRDYELVKIIEN